MKEKLDDDLLLSPIPEMPFLHIKKENVLVAADLHLGIEEEFLSSGITMPSQWPGIYDLFEVAVEETGVDKVYLLGDVKHRIPSPGVWERRSLGGFFSSLCDLVEVHVVPGNHDGMLASLVPGEVIFEPVRGVVVGDVGLFHGHTWPGVDVAAARVIVCGHTHPCIKLVDDMGTSYFLPCWIKGSFVLPEKLRFYKGGEVEIEGDGGEIYEGGYEREFVIMPAVSSLRRGVAVNVETGLGPMISNGVFNMEDAGVYLLDGTFLGALGLLGEGKNVADVGRRRAYEF